LRLLGDSIVNQQALKEVDANATTTVIDLLEHLSEHLVTFFYAKERLLFWIDENANDYLVKKLAAALDYVEMAVRDGVE
jgi:hypothetical protein